jgi:hypothetical protein
MSREPQLTLEDLGFVDRQTRVDAERDAAQQPLERFFAVEKIFCVLIQHMAQSLVV